MIIGAQKCGTTSLAAQLAQHPGICFSQPKEPLYFHKVQDWQPGLEAYHRCFSPREGQICGEASTMYTFLPEFQGTHNRLHAYNPQLKLIYVMRHPVDRVISNYAHDRVRGLIKDPPEVAVLRDPVYINRSRYCVQIRPYIELFGCKQVLLLVFEEYVSDQLRTLVQIATYLGLPPEPFKEVGAESKHRSVGEWYLKYRLARELVGSPAFQRARPHVPAAIRRPVRNLLSNKLEEKPSFSPSLRQTLWRFLEDDVRGIEELLGRRLDLWREEGIE